MIVEFFDNIFILHIERLVSSPNDSVPELLENSNGTLPTVWMNCEKHGFKNVNKPLIVLNFILTDKWLKEHFELNVNLC